MPQNQGTKTESQKKDSSNPRNESTPGQNTIGTSTSREINAENSPEVHDALNETQF